MEHGGCPGEVRLDPDDAARGLEGSNSLRGATCRRGRCREVRRRGYVECGLEAIHGEGQGRWDRRGSTRVAEPIAVPGEFPALDEIIQDHIDGVIHGR